MPIQPCMHMLFFRFRLTGSMDGPEMIMCDYQYFYSWLLFAEADDVMMPTLLPPRLTACHRCLKRGPQWFL